MKCAEKGISLLTMSQQKFLRLIVVAGMACWRLTLIENDGDLFFNSE